MFNSHYPDFKDGDDLQESEDICNPSPGPGEFECAKDPFIHVCVLYNGKPKSFLNACAAFKALSVNDPSITTVDDLPYINRYRRCMSP